MALLNSLFCSSVLPGTTLRLVRAEWGRQFENSPVFVGASSLGGTIEIAARIEDYARVRRITVGSGTEGVDLGEGPTGARGSEFPRRPGI